MSTLQASASPFDERLGAAAEEHLARGLNPKLTARLAALFSLLTILGGIFAQAFVSDRLVSFTDAALTAKNILANRSLFTLGFSVYMIEMTCQIASVALFYRLLRPVNGNIALIAAFVELTGCVIKTMTRLFYITPLFVLSGTKVLDAFNPEQRQALAVLLLRINERGAGLALALFGVSGVLMGYLIYRSTFLPSALGLFAMIGSAGWMRYYFPTLRVPSFMVIVVLALAVAMVKIYWLLVHGVDEKKWMAQYRRAMRVD